MQNIYTSGEWKPGCECGAGYQPGLVLDPFAGSGTVGVVAAALGRRFVGVDVSKEYVEMANERIYEEGLGMPPTVEDVEGQKHEQLPLF